MSDDVLQQALESLDLIQVGAALGLQLKHGAQRSPFRQDRRASFSVFDGGRAWKDHGADEQGRIWAFVERARPEWPKSERARWIIRLAGMDPDAGRRITTVERRERSRDRYLARHRERRRKEAEVPPLPAAEVWPDFVRDRYGEGWLRLRKDPLARSAIAEERGWLDFTVEQLVELGLVADPLLPWSDGERGVAFRVDGPPAAPGEDPPIFGYHQRFIRSGRKVWLYVPYKPSRAGTQFLEQLEGYSGPSVPSFPFVLGNLKDPSLIVILEGQWDAVSFWAACGGLGGSATARMAIFGLRGASSINIFLSAYRRMLHTPNLPPVWLIGDNDEAGRRWTTPASAQPGTHPEPSFSDRLRALGAGRLVTTFIRGEGIKDFNDWYYRTMPEPGDMARFFEKAGLEWVG